jgi:hypothetical protein
MFLNALLFIFSSRARKRLYFDIPSKNCVLLKANHVADFEGLLEKTSNFKFAC